MFSVLSITLLNTFSTRYHMLLHIQYSSSCFYTFNTQHHMCLLIQHLASHVFTSSVLKIACLYTFSAQHHMSVLKIVTYLNTFSTQCCLTVTFSTLLLTCVKQYLAACACGTELCFEALWLKRMFGKVNPFAKTECTIFYSAV